MDVSVKFLGGARTVTGSKYLLDIDFKQKIMVDCGLFQGPKNLRLRNWSSLHDNVSEISCVVITHAHLDHSGYLPKLVKDGFCGDIYCTNSTRDLLEILLLDSGRLQEEEANYARKKGYSKHLEPKPLYSAEDVPPVLNLIKTVPFDTPLSISDNIKIEFKNAGHILGSAIVDLSITGRKQTKHIVFSGDLGRQSSPLQYPPAIIDKADVLLMESTYGDREVSSTNTEDELAKIIDHMINERGCLLIPAFSVGRTQSILYYLVNYFKKAKIHNIPIYVDSPMAISVTDLYREYKSELKIAKDFFEDCIFDSPLIHYTRAAVDSKQLNEIKKNAIIISASGMCTGGRILHHLYNRLPHENDIVLFVGYQGLETRGHKILRGDETIKIFGEEVKIKAGIRYINNLSAHASKTELITWFKGIKKPPKRTFIVHGEEEVSLSLQKTLEDEGYHNVIVPNYGETFRLFTNL